MEQVHRPTSSSGSTTLPTDFRHRDRKAFFPEIAPESTRCSPPSRCSPGLFIVRPIGGIVWGGIGDKIGRRTRTLLVDPHIMSGATTLITFLPSYAQIGILGPILLLIIRMVQDFSASSEYAGATSFIAEYSPDNRRPLYQHRSGEHRSGIAGGLADVGRPVRASGRCADAELRLAAAVPAGGARWG